jgi:hypothetical protein
MTTSLDKSRKPYLLKSVRMLRRILYDAAGPVYATLRDCRAIFEIKSHP